VSGTARDPSGCSRPRPPATLGCVTRTVCLLALAFSFGCDKSSGTNAPNEVRGYKLEPTVYGPNHGMDQHAFEKCNFDKKLTSSVAGAIEAQGTGAKTGDGKTLRLIIEHVKGTEPDWAGDITVLINGVLHYHETDDKHEFAAHGHAVGGISVGVGGVCKGLDEIADELADHIVEWMSSPRHDAEIGDRPSLEL